MDLETLLKAHKLALPEEGMGTRAFKHWVHDAYRLVEDELDNLDNAARKKIAEDLKEIFTAWNVNEKSGFWAYIDAIRTGAAKEAPGPSAIYTEKAEYGMINSYRDKTGNRGLSPNGDRNRDLVILIDSRDDRTLIPHLTRMEYMVTRYGDDRMGRRIMWSSSYRPVTDTVGFFLADGTDDYTLVVGSAVPWGNDERFFSGIPVRLHTTLAGRKVTVVETIGNGATDGMLARQIARNLGLADKVLRREFTPLDDQDLLISRYLEGEDEATAILKNYIKSEQYRKDL